jgi:predicted ATPase
MLTQLTIHNFKSLVDVEVELGLVNVFVGANGSGKSNFLEALSFLSAAVDGRVDDQALLRRGARPSVSTLYKSSFKDTTKEEPIQMRARWAPKQSPSPLEYGVSFADVASVRAQPWSYQATLNSQTLPSLKFKNRAPSQLIFPETWPQPTVSLIEEFSAVLSDYAIFSPNTPTLRAVQPDLTQRQPVGLAGGQLAEAVSEMLAAAGEQTSQIDLEDLYDLLVDWVDEIKVVPASRKLVSASVPSSRNLIRFTDRWLAKGHNHISAYDASEGILYVLFIMVLALDPKSPRLFAVDNIDQLIHPCLARASIRLFCNYMLAHVPPHQALVTTHNPLVLDGLNLLDDRIRLFTVERNERGHTQIYRVQVSQEILNATQQGLTLSNLWVMGRLGGVPDIF